MCCWSTVILYLYPLRNLKFLVVQRVATTLINRTPPYSLVLITMFVLSSVLDTAAAPAPHPRQTTAHGQPLPSYPIKSMLVAIPTYVHAAYTVASYCIKTKITFPFLFSNLPRVHTTLYIYCTCTAEEWKLNYCPHCASFITLFQ